MQEHLNAYTAAFKRHACCQQWRRFAYRQIMLRISNAYVHICADPYYSFYEDIYIYWALYSFWQCTVIKMYNYAILVGKAVGIFTEIAMTIIVYTYNFWGSNYSKCTGAGKSTQRNLFSILIKQTKFRL